MMFAREHYSEALVDEMMPLWSQHHAENASENYGKLEPNLDMYKRCDSLDLLRVYTVRQAGKLCGYQVFIVSTHLHSKSQIQATQDILYVQPDARKGLMGYRFMKWCTEQLRAEGVHVVHQVISARHDFGSLLKRMGYQLEDLTYSKRFREVA